MKQSFTELEDKHHYVTLLEKHIEDLERKLEDAETQHNKVSFIPFNEVEMPSNP